MLEGAGMSEPAGKTLTEDQVLLIAKALGDRRRYEILKRLGERADALACGAVRDCTAQFVECTEFRALWALSGRGQLQKKRLG